MCKLGLRPDSAGAAARCALLVLIAAIFGAQKLIEIRVDRLSTDLRVVLGYGASIALFVCLAEYGWLLTTRRALMRRHLMAADRRFEWLIAGAATVGLLLTISAEWTSGYVVAYASSVPRILVLAILGLWGGFVAWLLSAKRTATQWMVVLLIMNVVTRTVGCIYSPVTGDMLSTVDQALGELLSGHQPYRVYPPAMPYFPLTFLSYLPAHLLGIDLRWSNVLIEGLIVLAVMYPRRSGSLSITAAALPVLALMPQWTIYGIDTTFPMSVLAVILVGNAIEDGTPWRQALLVGGMVAVNQTLAFVALFVGAHWLTQHGPRRTAVLIGLSMLPFAAFVFPFVAWDHVSFMDAAFGMTPFSPAQLVGRFTLQPAVERFVPGGGAVVVIAAGAAAITAILRRRGAEVTMMSAALAYCAFLLVLHRTFSHYYLPPIAMVLTFATAARTVPDRSEPRRG